MSKPRMSMAGLMASALALGLFAPRAARSQSAEEIIDAHVKAMGGVEAIKALKSVSRKGGVAVTSATIGEMAGVMELVLIPGRKAYQKMDLGVFIQSGGWNGDVAWQNGMMGLQKLEGRQADQIRSQAWLNALVSSRVLGQEGSIAKLDDEKVGETDHHVLEITPPDGGPKLKIYVDKATHLIAQTKLKQTDDLSGAEMDVTIKESDFADYGGVKLPGKVVIELVGGPMGDLTLTTTYSETSVNGEVDQSIFEMPTPAAAAPSAPAGAAPSNP